MLMSVGLGIYSGCLAAVLDEGIIDVIDMANSIANRADRVAACQVQPPLVSE